MKWTKERMLEADLVHGLGEGRTDTYRLSIEKTDDADGIRLDVPGWMVGDVEKAEMVVEAAKVIRKRLTGL